MNKLRVLDLFSGLGGFSLGLERTGGFETVAFCEIEKFPRRVLAKHWPEVCQYEDVRTLTRDILDRDGIAVDVITGGFPCQDISIAGRGAGLDGERSGLWFEYARIIAEIRPAYVIIENTRALLSRGLVRVLQCLREIGYDAVWHTIPASAVGSIQNRDRVWIIAYPSEDGKQRFFERLDLVAARQGGACRQEDLPEVYRRPFSGVNWPQPLVCGGRKRFPDWVDRIGACGNAVDPRIPEMIGRAILEAERASQNNGSGRDALAVAGVSQPRFSLNSPGASASGAFSGGA